MDSRGELHGKQPGHRGGLHQTNLLNGGFFFFLFCSFPRRKRVEKKRFSVHRLDTYHICNVLFPPLLPLRYEPTNMVPAKLLEDSEIEDFESTFNTSAIGGERATETRQLQISIAGPVGSRIANG